MTDNETKIIPITYYENKENNSVRVTRSGKIAAAILATTAALGVGYAAKEANTPDFHGEHTTTITENTVTGIAKDNVKGVDTATQDTVQKIVAMNPNVFQNGEAVVDGNDLGKTIEVPDSVDR